MAKRKTPKAEKVVDLTPKAEKITDEQLQTVTQQQRDLNQSLNALGVLEMQRQAVIDAVHKCQKDIESTKKELQDAYGDVNIDLKDGTYKAIEENVE